jgi:hypothetical protein
MALAVTMGIVVGFIVSRLGRKQTPYDDKDEFMITEEETKSSEKKDDAKY